MLKLRILRKMIRSPYFTLGLGIMLLLCGILEVVETVLEDFIGLEVHSRHGLMIFGIGQILKAFTDIFEGTDNIIVTPTA